MKKGTFYFLLFVLISSILVTPSFAHSGRTDAKGGHMDHSTGEYHYHHGYGPHQHIDGVCPYAFDDKTGQNSGSSNSSKPNSSTPTATKPPAETKDSTNPIVLASAAGILSVGVVKYGKHRSRIREERRSYEETRRDVQRRIYGEVHRKQAEERKRFEEERRRLEEEKRRKYEEARTKYISLYGGKTRNELARLAGMPNNTIIGEDNLPREFFGSDKEIWGYNYTFYVSPTGKAFHGTRSCNHAAYIPKHALHLGDRAPCSRCRPHKPALNWYWEYKKILNIVEKYNIEISEEYHEYNVERW
jgi:hypothetical protein